MSFGVCPREKELTGLLDRGHWPEAATDDLRAHVAVCRGCQDLALVTTAFRADRVRQAALPRLEPAGVLWWRAQLRRRHAALQQISRPLFGAQIFAIAVSLLGTTLFLLSQWKRSAAGLSWLTDLPRSLHLELLLPDAVQKSQTATWLFVSTALMLALAGGVFVYVKSEKR
jgi:hypothetical protein